MHALRCSCAIVCFVSTLVLAGSSAAQEPAGDDLIQLVTGLLTEADKDMRALGLEQIRSGAPGERATQQFAAQLPKLPLEVQVEVLRALAERGDRVARPAVLDVLKRGKDETLKVAALQALGYLGEPSDVRLLAEELAAGSQAERGAAQQSLVRLPGESVSRLIVEEMQLAEPSVRVALIEVLASRRAFEALPALLGAARGDEPEVRAAAMTALGELAGPEQIPGMLQGVLQAEPGREREAAEKSVMFACQRIGDPEARTATVLHALEEFDPAARTALLPTLGRVGGAETLKVVEAALADPDPERHEAGLRALSNWPNAAVAPQLVKLSQTDSHPDHRLTALRALIRVAPLSDGRSAAEKLQLLQQAMDLSTRDTERKLILKRAAAVRTVETLRFLLPYLDQPPLAQQASQSVVELAHHRNLREPNKAEFDRALDKVLKTSQDATILERARRYKKGQTWAPPTTSQ